MRTTLIDVVRKIIRSATTRVGGPVGNWQGAVVKTTPLEVIPAIHSWAEFVIVAPGLPNLNAFFARYNRMTTLASLLLSDDTGWTTTVIKPGTAVALKGVVRSEGRSTTTLSVKLEGAGQAAVYVNNTLIRSGYASFSVPLSLDAGAYTIVVTANASSLSVQASEQLDIDGSAEVPAAPEWVALTTGYLDAQQGSAANTLTWTNEITSGGVRILRRNPVAWEPSNLVSSSPPPATWGTVLGVSTLFSDGTVSLTLATGQVSADATIQAIVDGQEGDILANVFGNVLFIGNIRVGVVQGINYALRETDASNSELLLTVRCLLDPQLSSGSEAWVNQKVSTGDYTEIYRENNLSRATTGTFVDGQVMAGMLYQYVLQAHGLLDANTWSDFSDVRFIVAGDLTPPNTVSGLTVSVMNGVATAEFVAPDDADYAGTKIVRRLEALADDDPRTFYEVTDVTGNVVTVTPATLPTASGGLTGYYMRFGDPDVAVSQFFYTVTSNTSSALTLNMAPDEDENFVGEDVYLYTDEEAALASGLPGQQTQVTFTPRGYGEYLFLPYDVSGNVAAEDRTDALWDYDVTDDRFFAEPILAVRQLTSTEQQYFAGYTDLTTYAIFEVFAYSPTQVPGITTTIYYQKRGDVSETSLASSVYNASNVEPHEVGGFPVIVSAPGAVIDVPAGTRSRYIALSRTGGNAWLRVRVEDSQGRLSSTLTFVADFDATPEITGLEASISNTSDSATFTAVVDDDTQAVQWWVTPASGSEPTEGAKQTVDTRTTRTFTRTVALALGTRKELILEPFPTYDGSTVSGTAGATLRRELVRTPRSFVNLDPKDAEGNRSAEKITAKFSVIPEPALVVGTASVPVAMTSFTAPNIITDTTKAWTTNQFAATNVRHYYAEVIPPAQNGVAVPAYLRKILSNTATSLSLAGTPPATYTMTGAEYRIWDGGVEIRTRAVGSAAAPLRAGYAGTIGTEVFDRAASFILEFFGTKTGCLVENERLVVVDEDTKASLSGFAYSYSSSSGEATVGFASADDDAKFWRCYEKKGTSTSWPTLDGSQNGPLDPLCLKFSGPITQASYAHYVTGASGYWNAIAVPVNGLNEDGDRAFAQLDLAATPTGLISSYAIREGANDEVNIYYEHSVGLTGTVTITAYRADLGAGSTVTLVSGRTVSDDASGASPTANYGSYKHDTGENLTGTSSDTPRTWHYTITHSGGTVKSATWSGYAVIAGYSGSLTALTSTVQQNGLCVGGVCWEPHVRRITWTATGISDDDYALDVYVSDNVAGPWTLAFSGLQPSIEQVDDYTECLYYDAGGSNVTWAYKTEVRKKSDNSIVETDTTSVSQTVLGCSGGYEV